LIPHILKSLGSFFVLPSPSFSGEKGFLFFWSRQGLSLLLLSQSWSPPKSPPTCSPLCPKIAPPPFHTLVPPTGFFSTSPDLLSSVFTHCHRITLPVRGCPMDPHSPPRTSLSACEGLPPLLFLMRLPYVHLSPAHNPLSRSTLPPPPFSLRWRDDRPRRSIIRVAYSTSMFIPSLFHSFPVARDLQTFLRSLNLVLQSKCTPSRVLTPPLKSGTSPFPFFSSKREPHPFIPQT